MKDSNQRNNFWRPNFVVVGPPRTATTWLFRCFDKHTQVFVPNVKETRYFDENYQYGENWYGSLYQDCPTSAKAIGDITPGYFAHPKTPARIRAALGSELTLFIIVRDPIDRAYSHYNILQKNGCAADTFEADLAQGSAALESSLYAKHIQRFVDLFGEENICLLSHQELLDTPEQYWEKIQSRLDLDLQPEALITEHVNPTVGKSKKNPLIATLVTLKKHVEKTRIGRKLLWLMRDLGLIKLWHRFTRSQAPKLSLSDSDREHLFQTYFATDQHALIRYQHLYL